MKLADTYASGAYGRKALEVQVLSRPQKFYSTNYSIIYDSFYSYILIES